MNTTTTETTYASVLTLVPMMLLVLWLICL